MSEHEYVRGEGGVGLTTPHYSSLPPSVRWDGCEISTQPDCGQAGVAAGLAGLVCPTPTCTARGPWTDWECWCRCLLSGIPPRIFRPGPPCRLRYVWRGRPPGWPRPSPTCWWRLWLDWTLTVLSLCGRHWSSGRTEGGGRRRERWPPARQAGEEGGSSVRHTIRLAGPVETCGDLYGSLRYFPFPTGPAGCPGLSLLVSRNYFNCLVSQYGRQLVHHQTRPGLPLLSSCRNVRFQPG